MNFFLQVKTDDFHICFCLLHAPIVGVILRWHLWKRAVHRAFLTIDHDTADIIQEFMLSYVGNISKFENQTCLSHNNPAFVFVIIFVSL